LPLHPSSGSRWRVAADVAFFNCSKPKAAPHNFDAPDGVVMLPSGDPAHPHLFGFATDPGHFAIRRIDVEKRQLIEPRFPIGPPPLALAGHVAPLAWRT